MARCREGRGPRLARAHGLYLLEKLRTGCSALSEHEVGHVATELLPGLVIEPRVDAGVDPAEAGLARGRAEAGERAGHARQGGRG